MTKEKGLGQLQQRRLETERQMAEMIRERVREQKEDWQAIGSQLLEWNNSADFRYLIVEKGVLPIMAAADSPYMFVDLKTGEILEQSDSWDPELLPAGQEAVLRFSEHPERLDAAVMQAELEAVEGLREKWGYYVRYKLAHQKDRDYLINGGGVYETGEELIKWLIIGRLVAWEDQGGEEMRLIDKAIKELGIVFKDAYDGVHPSLAEVWSFIDDGVVKLDRERFLTLKLVRKIDMG